MLFTLLTLVYSTNQQPQQPSIQQTVQLTVQTSNYPRQPLGTVIANIPNILMGCLRTAGQNYAEGAKHGLLQ